MARINERLKESQFEPVKIVELAPPATPVAEPAKGDWLENWLISLEIAFRGGLREDPDEFQKRLISRRIPAYPAIAQKAGLQGFVKLQVRVMKDGSVEAQKLLEGDPTLADAAIIAVRQWRAKPLLINGKPVEVISTVTFNFQLNERQ
jgi:TonB family protein